MHLQLLAPVVHYGRLPPKQPLVSSHQHQLSVWAYFTSAQTEPRAAILKAPRARRVHGLPLLPLPLLLPAQRGIWPHAQQKPLLWRRSQVSVRGPRLPLLRARKRAAHDPWWLR